MSTPRFTASSSGNQPTSRDVADRAGVSRTAVSFAYNNPSRISEETRQRILQAANDLGYTPNPMAQMLKRGKSGTLGVLLPQAIPAIMQNPYYGQFLTGLGEVCDREGMTLLLCPPLRNSMLKAIPYAAVDGFIVTGLESDRGEVEELRRRGIPFVLVDSEPLPGVPRVDTDDELGAFNLVQHLLQLGHRHVTFVLFEGGPDAQTLGYRGPLGLRIEGFKRALAAYDLTLESPGIQVMEAPCTRQGGLEIGRHILSAPNPPTAIIATSDIMAIGIMEAARILEVAIPAQLSVAGFDDQPEAQWTYPALTTVRQSTETKGHRAGDFLVAEIQGRDNHPTQTIQTTLITRGSTGPVPSTPAPGQA
ncbi:MAG: LacI family DNA-binding transcriptional regulator [Micropruina sp.]|nr:LacI family DNA-binding transcriptional regulator [Micropruina sp.]